MKTKSFLLFALCCMACQRKQQTPYKTLVVSVLSDKTDLHQVQPTAGDIIPLFGFKDDPNKAVHFTLQSVTDKVMNLPVSVMLPSDSVTRRENVQQIPQYRKRRVVSFLNRVSKTIQRYTADTSTGLSHSEIYSALVQEICRIKKQGATRAVIVLYSNLQENSSFFSCYSKEGKQLLVKHPDKVVRQFAQFAPLSKDLTVFTLCIVYAPQNREEDSAFRAMAEVYKTLFASTGAKLIITPTLQNHMP